MSSARVSNRSPAFSMMCWSITAEVPRRPRSALGLQQAAGLGAALEHRLPRVQPLVVGQEPIAAGAVLLRRGGRGHQRHTGLPQPDIGLLVQESARLLDVAV